MNEIAITFLCIATIILLIIFFCKKKKQKQKKEYEMEMKSRNDSLDQQLSNPYSQKKEGTYHPYQINYMEGTEGNAGKNAHLFQLTEKTEYAVRRYLFQRDETVYIGKQEGNLSVFKTEPKTNGYCKISCKQELYCIKAIGNEKIQIKRGKTETVIDHKGIVLKNNDKICLLGAEYTFRIVR